MKLALILGKKQGETIKPRLQSIKDNLDIDVFEDVSEYVYSVSKRNTIYDRILILSKKVTPSSLKELNTCWGMYSKETAVVMLSHKGTDEEKALQFLNVFKTPVACAMLVTSTTVQVIAESVLRPVVELNNEYGIKDFLQAEVEEDSYVPEPEPVVQPIQSPVQPVQTVAKQKEQKKSKKKHGGFFSGIFGSRGGDVEEPEQKPVPSSEPIPKPEPQYNQQNERVQVNFDPVPQVQFESGVGTQLDSQVSDLGASDESSQDYTEVSDDFGMSEESSDFEPTISQEPLQHISPVQQSAQTHVPPPIPSVRLQQNLNINQVSPSSLVNVSFDETFVEEQTEEDDFAPEPTTTDVDFGGDGTLIEHPQPESAPQVKPSVVQADANFGDVNLRDAESQYRHQKEAPKVITRTIKEPVLGSGSVVKSVYAGRLNKVIIVTGDRGSGVTSTALNIAQTVAKHINTLYFDCDVDNHGLLNYIDYLSFKNYEQLHMTGVKVCHSSKVFSNCVISWDDNLNLLTSDYSCDCTDDELRATAEIVAEKANDFGVVVVDCPVAKLPLIADLVLIGQSVICVEGTKRGFMNMLCQLESNALPTRYKRNLISRGTMFVTKCHPNLDLKKLISYIKAIYQPDEVDFLSPKPVPFNGKLDDALLNEVMEG